jgi:serine/threonine protein kinase
VTIGGGFPKKFDSYALLKPLARGGMGQLYLALAGTPGLQKLCVIKQVPPDVIAPENARRFRDEAMVALRLAHGNLVSVFDAGIHAGEIFLAMEFVDGRDLHAVWNRCAERRIPFPVDVAAYVIKELVRGLAYAHSFENLELVHRDVSPANVLLSFSGEVKLTDFGLATSVLKLERTAPGIIYGKVSYLAPEQARREPLDGRSDLYAAGILLWELLTGRQLFPLRTAADDGASPSDANAGAIRRARNPDIIPPSQLSDRVPLELERIVMRALAPEREDRYPNGEAMRADLASFLAETAPKTDAARMADFLRPLFSEDARVERRERDALIAEATTLLSGAIDARGSATALARGVGSKGSAGTVARPSPDAATRPVTPAAAAALAEIPAHRAEHGSDPRVGSTIGGRYYLRRLCGEGAMGRVYESHHIDIGRRVAIKILHANFHNDAALVERFRREARAASKIGHPNIVDVTDSGTTPDGAFYFVMEYLDGIDLEQLIAREGALPVERALLIAAQMTRALEAAHAADIIHRDLKPANVMLVRRNDEDDFVKVLDFGISKDLDVAVGDRNVSLTRPDVAIGTPVYMAPEQAAGRPANALTDVYAVGGLLYEMLTGEPPCAGEDAIAVLHRKANEDPTPISELRPDLPREVQYLVMRALARSPGERHQSMALLKESLLAAIGVAGSAPTLTPPLVRTVLMPAVPQRTRVPLVTGVLLATSVAAAGAYLVLGAIQGGRTAEPTPLPLTAVTDAPAAAVPQTPAHRPPRLAAGSPVTWPEPASSSTPALTPPPSPAPAPVVARHEPPRARTASPAPTSTTRGSAPRSVAARPAAAVRTSTNIIASLEATEAILGRGQRAFDRGDYPEAVRRGREAVAAGGTVAGHLLVGDAYYRLERYAEAVREYEAVLVVEPTNGPAKRRRILAAQRAAR